MRNSFCFVAFAVVFVADAFSNCVNELIQVSQVDFFAQEQSCSLVVEDHNKATALNYLKPEGVSKLWNNDSAC
ncbi:MAG: hypothetical protein IKR25_09945, partial [Muribaculaceae bacterium]|nr:hypothetical protein [Muribaculaceae bacterium]